MVAALLCALPVLCVAQRVPLSSSAMTNRDVWTLAEAGFSEEFIVDVIQTSRTQFDTCAIGLVELSKHAVTERIIRTMLDQSNASSQGSQSQQAAMAMAASGQGQVSLAVPMGTEPRAREPRAPRITPTAMAISSGQPYYEWKSYFFGAYKKRVGVGTVNGGATQYQVIAPHLGTMYQRVRMQDMPQSRSVQSIRFLSPGGYPVALQ